MDKIVSSIKFRELAKGSLFELKGVIYIKNRVFNSLCFRPGWNWFHSISMFPDTIVKRIEYKWFDGTIMGKGVNK